MELLSRVLARGEALGNAEKALSRSFEVFAGRNNTIVTCVEFAQKLSNLSVSWTSFSSDECLALAMSLNFREEDLDHSVVTFEDFKRFAFEKCTDKNGKKGKRGGVSGPLR